MLKGIAEYFLAAQVPDQHSRVVTATVTRISNGLCFAQAHNGQPFVLNPAVQKRLGFDAVVCSEGATLLPEDKLKPAVGDRLLLMILVDKDGRVVMDVMRYVILWINVDRAEDRLKEFSKSDLMRVYVSGHVKWIGPSAWLPHHYVWHRREVFRGGVWRPFEHSSAPVPRKARPIVSVGTAFEGLQVPAS